MKNYPLYEEGVTYSKDFRDLIEIQASRYPSRAAFRFMEDGKDVTVTRLEFKKAVDSLGTAICSLGIHREHLAVLGDNCYQWLL